MSDGSLYWLSDEDLEELAAGPPAAEAIMSQRYDPACPSEFYRGYGSVLSWLTDGPFAGRGLGEAIDEIDGILREVDAGEQLNGANFAVMNVAQYLNAAPVPQIVAHLGTEQVCIAQCFLRNRSAGI
jgi:hypothetical protein